ncbi:MAG TPA: C4-type zinc ribbon domain-containing protein [Acidobacteriaceae bacterium]|nr:C4-type zinc ribbon domain-containing protein [Acidobacteriaceae bacterium]
MHPDLLKLIDLQSLDDELRREHDHIAALGKSLAAAESKAKTAEVQLAGIREAMAKEEALRRREESDIADLRQKFARDQKKMDMATTTAQVTALEHELAFLKSEISRLEDQELESMERSETLEAQQATAAQAAADAIAALDRERSRSTDETAAAHATIAAVESRRAVLRTEIAQSSQTGDTSLSTYDRIARAKGHAVAQALDHKCSACQMMVRPQRWNDLIDNSPESPASQSLMTCETCGRLLYYDPARDAPQRKPATPDHTESIAAQIVRSSI